MLNTVVYFHTKDVVFGWEGKGSFEELGKAVGRAEVGLARGAQGFTLSYNVHGLKLIQSDML